MKKITLYSVMALLCLYVTAQPKTVKTLFTGDRLPNVIFTQVLKHSGIRSLADFQQNHQKLVLLDFWHTTCIPCIRSFKKLDSLQKIYQNRLQILLVTPEDSNIVKPTIERWEKANNQRLDIPVVTGDTLLQRYIHKQYNPHYAWIAPDNVLIAQTSSSFITSEILNAYLNQMMYEVDKRGYLKRNHQPKR